ncbi:related to N-alpha-acetyltransferase, 35 NatC auxiliary subunit [Nakaseomyces glabratus]|nr:Mak10 subunit, NatC N(alpha)-terminal acetyltransferase [Nakaseomyces glabratus]QNG13215.1 uncharacterized protein GWK60_E03839 [Nakaseomyces glabratus]SCV14180.1 related to N-alpha-acetyltransferase, 35 NatC auxiliary subunit [Nakaseomyces glabratus]SLM12710.1 related to N-alpha-acetyltransferase, 35 NatC auxiliary subunit [Nakaseomyces glabratus]
MRELGVSMESLSLETPTVRDGLVDVTALFMEMGKKLKPETIVKDSKFNLFDGTHSLEVNNEKLDSTMIQLTPEELQFDVGVAYGEELDASTDDPSKLDIVIAISDRLLRSIISWLNDYQSLPTTVLSCIYVEHVLKYYMMDENADQNDITCLETGDPFYDQVLNSIIIGVCNFMGFMYKVLTAGVIFEEEDLNFNHMGLNNFGMLPGINESLRALEVSRTYLDNLLDTMPSHDSKINRLRLLLNVTETLVKFEYLVDCSSEQGEQLLNVLETSAKLLIEQGPFSIPPPLGAFSMGIQRKLTNQFPPKKLIEPKFNFAGYIIISEHVKLVNKLKTLNTAKDIFTFALYFNKLSQKHVLARALFSLILIKPDQSILNKHSIIDFLQMHLKEISGRDWIIGEAIDYELQGILQEAGNVLLEFYQNAAQNTCRYRQGYNRQILLWDSLQAQLESKSSDISVSQADIDTVTGDKEEGSVFIYVCASWVYIMKLTAMTEFILKGFELDIYKPYESFSMYWYCYCLQLHLKDCLEKLINLVSDKMNSIYAINKKMKKLKAGEKKENVRKQYRHAMDSIMPDLKESTCTLSLLLKKCEIHRALCLGEVLQFAILRSYQLIDGEIGNKLIVSNRKLLHDLRFKTFSSIGVPELPSYDVFKKTLSDFTVQEPLFDLKMEKTLKCITNELTVAEKNLAEIIALLEENSNSSEDFAGYDAVKNETHDYYDTISKSIMEIKNNVTALVKNHNNYVHDKGNYEMKLTKPDKASPYYVVMDMVEKRSHHKT